MPFDGVEDVIKQWG